MPKKGGKQTRAQKEAEDESYKAPGLTLSNFLVLPQTKPAAQTVTESQDDFPSLTPQNASSANSVASDQPLTAGSTDSAKQHANEITFKIKRTKKGGLPLAYESRAKGKKVTVISNCSGDTAALLSLLKRATGTGGAAKGETVELQGDHRKFLEKYLHKHPCLH